MEFLSLGHQNIGRTLDGQGGDEKRVCSLRTTSSACVPIEPEEPIRLTERIRSPEVECLDREVRRGENEEQAIHSVQNAAVPRKDPAHVLDPEVALEQ